LQPPNLPVAQPQTPGRFPLLPMPLFDFVQHAQSVPFPLAQVDPLLLPWGRLSAPRKADISTLHKPDILTLRPHLLSVCLTIELRGKKLLRMVEALGKFSRVAFADYFWSPDRVC
jgi:hypothetical protein